MALVVKDRVRQVTTTVGTGTLTLSGTVSGFQTFSVIGNGNTTYYAIVDNVTGDWEVGVGTYTSSGTTLSRDIVLESSNSNNLVPFAAGTKDVFCTYPADLSVTSDYPNVFTVANTFRSANAIRSEAAATQDAVVLAGRAGGTSSFAVTLTPANLSSSTTLTLPNVTDTVATIGTAQTFTAAQTFRAANAIRSEAAATQDAIVVAGRAGGTNSFASTITLTTLTANRTVTLPNSDVNFVTGLAPANGGTGTTSLTANNVILGNGTSSVLFVAPGTSGNVLTSNGTTWASTAPAAGSIFNYQEFTNSGTWTKPSGATWVYIEAIGGGGSGGAFATTSGTTVATGGGGGAFASGWVLASSLGANVTVTVGSGGTAVTSTSPTGVNGNNGGDTTFGTSITARGGRGGIFGAILNTAGGEGGGGELSAATITFAVGGYSSGSGGRSGQSGANCVMGGAGGGGAQISGGTATSGAGGASQNGGNGGAAAGTVAASTNVTATSGVAPGGGGGGAVASNATPGTATSGAGGIGRVRVWTL